MPFPQRVNIPLFFKEGTTETYVNVLHYEIYETF